MVDNAKGKQPPYEGSGSTTPTAPTTKRRGRADRAREALDAAVRALNQGQFDGGSDLDGFVTSLGLPDAPPGNAEDKCTNPRPAVAAPCNQRELDFRKADTRHKKALKSAESAFDDEVSNWEQAVSQYEFAIRNADAELQSTVKDAKDTYDKKSNQDSETRALNLYYTMKEAVATAIQAYQTKAAAAAATLAGEAGTLAAARATYVAAVNAAEAQRLADEALADQTFWQTVEGIREAR
jgi:hypothetical protein